MYRNKQEFSEISSRALVLSPTHVVEHVHISPHWIVTVIANADENVSLEPLKLYLSVGEWRVYQSNSGRFCGVY